MGHRRPDRRAGPALVRLVVVAVVVLAGCSDTTGAATGPSPSARSDAAAVALLPSPTATSAATDAPGAAEPSPTSASSRSDAASGVTTLGEFAVAGRFPDAVGAEVSGVAGGREVAGVWLVDDEPGTDEVHLVGLDGTASATVTLRGVRTVNPEDIAVGPCPEDAATSCVHVADIGDNVGGRDDVVVWSFPEEVAADGGRVVVDPRPRRLRYEAGPVDAEALAVTTDGTVVLVDKSPDVAGVHVAQPGDDVLRRVGGIELPEPALPFFELIVGRVVTAADLLPDDSALLLRTYDEVLELAAPAGGRIDPAAIPDLGVTQLPGPGDLQGEAIAYIDDGERVVAVAEGSAAIRVAQRRARTTGERG